MKKKPSRRKQMNRLIYILFLLSALCVKAGEPAQSIFLVHTSDTHSCIEPTSPTLSDTAQADKGGFVRRAALVKKLRSQHPGNMLLLDCGDFSQGSVYYNLFRGDVEVKLMNEMQYDACTIGNHEFDFGMENMARIFKMARFPIVCCNYDFKGTPCEGLVKPYIVLERNGIRIGIFGVCPKPDGLVSKQNFQGMGYTDAVSAAQPVIDRLRGEERCDVVICLSHLGWDIGGEDDKHFVSKTSGIDILLGGHSHTYFQHPQHLLDKNGHEVTVEHMGKNARFVGTMDIAL